jgi:predicted transcriptional regulator
MIYVEDQINKLWNKNELHKINKGNNNNFKITKKSNDVLEKISYSNKPLFMKERS